MKTCDACGKQYRGSYGLRAEYSMYGENGAVNYEFCAKCARSIIPGIICALSNIQSIRDSIREKATAEQWAGDAREVKDE